MWTAGRPRRGSVPRRWVGRTATGDGPVITPSWSTRSNGKETNRREAAFGTEGTSVRVSAGDHQGLAIAVVRREGLRHEPAGGPAHPGVRQAAAHPRRRVVGGDRTEVQPRPRHHPHGEARYRHREEGRRDREPQEGPAEVRQEGGLDHDPGDPPPGDRCPADRRERRHAARETDRLPKGDEKDRSFLDEARRQGDQDPRGRTAGRSRNGPLRVVPGGAGSPPYSRGGTRGRGARV